MRPAASGAYRRDTAESAAEKPVAGRAFVSTMYMPVSGSSCRANPRVQSNAVKPRAAIDKAPYLASHQEIEQGKRARGGRQAKVEVDRPKALGSHYWVPKRHEIDAQVPEHALLAQDLPDGSCCAR